ncbi:hypothetical protein Acid345_0031 [Candidatus Koribacter versatilis Ellin345]|uniref:DoxX n=1 Tax=Koribacter versatilis (strain Ellin345) TaxID=204669 RepID=Q1IVR4_KORVE|nr:hypothetical protein [Candidatus Koribacter versatilis]ABF39036.1 hypothetical protein Acid345_0031 [Candidatus Koribacter versatilis Ellin345]
MTQQLLTSENVERPVLILPIAIVCFSFAAVLCICGVLSLIGSMSLRLAAQLLGSGLEVMGPTPFFLYTIALCAGGTGLLLRQNWARLLTVILCAVGILFVVPHISSAVVDERYAAMSLDGVQILVRMAIASYLWREREWFV